MPHGLCFAQKAQVEAILGRFCDIHLVWFPGSNSFLKVGEQVARSFVSKSDLPREESRTFDLRTANSIWKFFVPVAIRLVNGEVWRLPTGPGLTR